MFMTPQKISIEQQSSVSIVDTDQGKSESDMFKFREEKLTELLNKSEVKR